MTLLRSTLMALGALLIMGCTTTEQAPAPGGEPEMEDRTPEQQQPAPGGQQPPGGADDGGYQQPGGGGM